MTSTCLSRRLSRGNAVGCTPRARHRFKRFTERVLHGARAAVLTACLFSIVGCSKKDDATPAPPTTAPVARAAAQGAAVHVNEVLDQWEAGRRDDAVGGLLRLTESDAPSESLRPSNLSETEFAAKFAALATDEAERMRMALAGRWTLLIQLIREIGSRGDRALEAGDVAEAERLYGSLQRVARANRGPDSQVSKLGNMVGEAAERRATEGFAKIRARQSTTATSNSD